ncbi:glycosyl hydrolase [soil metagenome]
MLDKGLIRCVMLLAITACLAAAPATQTAPPPATRPVISLHADTAEQHGTLYATTRPGYTGAAYVTGIDGDDDHLTWHAKSELGGIYLAEIRYSTDHRKRYDLAVNGVGHEDFFPETGDAFATHAAGKVVLNVGDNLIELKRGWGFYDVDRVELIPTNLPEPKKPPATLSDPEASPATKALMQSLVNDYGRVTRSGVISPKDAKIVHDRAGVWPAIMAGDLMDYSPTRLGHNVTSESPPERMIYEAHTGYVISMMWHWNAPAKLIDAMIQVDGKTIDARWFSGFNANATAFDLAAALKDPNGENYKLLLRDIDAIAVQLSKFDAAGVPILWRPLHEADGGWFWWGSKGPDAFKQLWSLMHDRLTNHHHLHNLIWVYTGTANWEWYPPADEFDVVGVDFYPNDPRDPASAIWDAINARYGDRKLIALTETRGVPDLAAAAKLGVRWSYFVSWGDANGPGIVPADELKRLYAAPTIFNRSTTKPTAP